MKTIGKTFVLASLLMGTPLTFGCATTGTPEDLENARTAYVRATSGPASQADPADLHTAKEALDVAEQTFVNEGNTQRTRDAAYTAERKAELAESRARTIQVMNQKDATLGKMHKDEEKTVKLTSAQLDQTRQQLANQGQQLATETQRRQDAERRAAQAAADLAKIASVKQETRGMVITLSGAVLFASGKSELLPAAQAKLSEVANALTKQDPDSKIIVEGHTDSQGPASFNQDLSQHRAESVRDYLVSHGIARDRVTAQGFGPTRPVADNASAEGRADNRRVEIVVPGQNSQDAQH